VPVDTLSEECFDTAACVAQVRRRDEDAARRLMEHLYPLVLKIVRSHLPRRLDEEDLTQMVFMKVFSSLGQYSGLAPFEHWVSRIAVNTCLNQLKAEKVRPELRWADLSEEQVQILDALQHESGELAASDSVGALDLTERLLAPLAPQDRLLLTWLHLEGRSCDDIAELTGWNRTAVRVRAFRARRKLKRLFAKLISEEKL
jgi:RNA polymerase sigma-70 factor (ECF subfamily)